MRDIRQLPADETPDAFGLKFPTGALQELYLPHILLARVATLEVGAQFAHPREQRRCVGLRGVAIDFAEVGQETPRGSFVSHLGVIASDSIQEFPHITAAELHTSLSLGGEITLRTQPLPSRRPQEFFCSVQ